VCLLRITRNRFAALRADDGTTTLGSSMGDACAEPIADLLRATRTLATLDLDSAGSPDYDSGGKGLLF
jgi:hypothetical protein